MQSEKRYTKYLKAKDADDMDQLQQGLNTMIKQELGPQSGFKQVADTTEVMLILDINSVPSRETLARFLENEPNSINPKIEQKVISACRHFLLRTSETKAQQEAKTPQTKLKTKAKSSTSKRKDSDSDGQTESNDDDMMDGDLDAEFERLMSPSNENSTSKKQTESDALVTV